MTFNTIAAVFGVMVVGALVPGVSVLAVSARSATSGFIHGVFTTLGIMLGDIIFILFAIIGLSLLAEKMGSLFVIIKYLGGAYLIWLGIALWRSKSNAVAVEGVTKSSLLSSFLTGLFITLGDQKAILFYFGFFPALLDLSRITYFDTGIIIAMAIVSIGAAKLAYAWVAARSSMLISAKAHHALNITAGSVMMGAGLYLLART